MVANVLGVQTMTRNGPEVSQCNPAGRLDDLQMIIEMQGTRIKAHVMVGTQAEYVVLCVWTVVR